MGKKAHNVDVQTNTSSVTSILTVEKKEIVAEEKKESITCNIIDVPESFEVQNGVTGMRRDVVIGVLLRVDQEKDMRAVIGMSTEHFLWKKHSYFKLMLQKFVFMWSDKHKSSQIKVSRQKKTASVVGSVKGLHIILMHSRKLTCGVVTITLRLLRMPVMGKYALGVLFELPRTFEEGFGYAVGNIYHHQARSVPGYAFHDLTIGIFNGKEKVVDVTGLGFQAGDTVTVHVDVGRGDLVFHVKGEKRAELKDDASIREGVYLAAQMSAMDAEWAIVSVVYRP